ncbi:high mobility group B protein 6 [Pistacia vera]|uniref:high mobility group B protein 6 n=1 Tax=Pistacia vera TaxID=55513 RepID=UPI0012637BBF|nr:high mobility group B protein 6 [Pistacia vera]
MTQNLKMTVTATTGGEQKLKPKSGRKPLQPLNSLVSTPTSNIKNKPKEKQECIDQKQNQIPVVGDLNKEKEEENHVVTKLESLDASLAEELSAMRKKLERLRLDKEKTEKMLNERDTMLDMQMKELQYRGDTQKMLEIEVDRLYRLKELKSYCLRISSIRSLREKEQEKRITGVAKSISHNLGGEDDDEEEEESVGENTLQSPCSSPVEEITEKEK